MHKKEKFSLGDIEEHLAKGELPFTGRTELGSTRFAFLRPAAYCATAIHASGNIRKELLPCLKINRGERLREEDPGTDRFLINFPIQIKAIDSRYEYDLNREPERAIYDIAWEVEVWKSSLSASERDISLAKHKEFHRLMNIVAQYLIRLNGFGIILDIHSFNYRRQNENEDIKPDINIGTAAVNRSVFGKLIEDFILRLKHITINGKFLRVAENDIFSGGYLSRRISSEYYDNILVLAVEFKKIYMDEWTGKIFRPVLEEMIAKFHRVVEETFNLS